MKKSDELRNKVGSIPIMNNGHTTDDNVAIAFVTYFDGLPECPDDDIDDQIGWSQWAVDKTNDVIDRIINTLEKEK